MRTTTAPRLLTVTPCWWQSCQNLVAENFLLETMVRPWDMAAPSTITPAAAWYMGRAE